MTSRYVSAAPRLIAELKNGPLAHLPSGRFASNAVVEFLVDRTTAHRRATETHNANRKPR
jgi:hypothetical protein